TASRAAARRPPHQPVERDPSGHDQKSDRRRTGGSPDCIDDDREAREGEDRGRNWVTPGPERPVRLRSLPPQHEEGADGDGREENDRKPRVGEELLESPRKDEKTTPRRLRRDRDRRSSEPRVDAC